MAENSRAERKGRGGDRGQGFKPGQSGNPGGRPKAVADVIAAARERTSLALSVLEEIAADKRAPAAARATSAIALLDRGWGKAPQRIEVGAGPEAMTTEQLMRIAAGAVAGEDGETRH